MLTRELAQRGGALCCLVGAVWASALQARIIGQKREVASLTVNREGMWMYQFSQQIQRNMQLIASKKQPQAVRMTPTLMSGDT